MFLLHIYLSIVTIQDNYKLTQQLKNVYPTFIKTAIIKNSQTYVIHPKSFFLVVACLSVYRLTTRSPRHAFPS
jgi:hypothetical protein